MGCRLVLLLLMLAVVDVWLLYRIAVTWGFFWALAVTFGPGLLGGDIARRQRGLAFHDMQAAINRGEAPSQKLVEGLMLLFVGVLLIMPGPVSSVLGLLLLVPFIRGLVAKVLIATARRQAEARAADPEAGGGVGAGPLHDGVFVRVVQVGGVQERDARDEDSPGAPLPRPRPVLGPDGLKSVEGRDLDSDGGEDDGPSDPALSGPGDEDRGGDDAGAKP